MNRMNVSIKGRETERQRDRDKDIQTIENNASSFLC